jgi:HSP20 family protein
MTMLTRYRMPFTRLWPWGEVDDLSRTLRRFFPDVEGPVGSLFEKFPFSPAIDVVENENELILTAELPGLERDDVTVEVENNILTLKGEKKEEHEQKDARYHMWERGYGAFERSIPLPRTVRADAIKAAFVNGVLKVTLPKVAEAKGRKIPVEMK